MGVSVADDDGDDAEGVEGKGKGVEGTVVAGVSIGPARDEGAGFGEVGADPNGAEARMGDAKRRLNDQE